MPEQCPSRNKTALIKQWMHKSSYGKIPGAVQKTPYTHSMIDVVLGVSGLDMSTWNTADIEALNLTIGNRSNGTERAVKSSCHVSVLLINQNLLKINSMSFH